MFWLSSCRDEAGRNECLLAARAKIGEWTTLIFPLSSGGVAGSRCGGGLFLPLVAKLPRGVTKLGAFREALALRM